MVKAGFIDVDIDNTGAVKCSTTLYCSADEDVEIIKETLEERAKRLNIPHFEVEIMKEVG